MAKKLNPYHLWLGLPETLNAPNYFQLLGIDADTANADTIAGSARANAQALLDKLTALELSSTQEKRVRDKIKKRIVQAHQTISDPIQRQQYRAVLLAKQSAPPQKPTLPAKPTPGPPAPSSSIPMAIPVPPPLPLPTPDPIETLPGRSPAQPDRANGTSGDPFAAIEADETIRIRPARVRGKRSSIVPLIVMLLVIVGIGGVVSLTMNYNNLFDVLAQQAQQAQQGKQADIDPSNAPGQTDTPPPGLKVPDNFDQLRDSQSAPADLENAPDAFAAKSPFDGNMDIGQTDDNADRPTPSDRQQPGGPSPINELNNASVLRIFSDQIHLALLDRAVDRARAISDRQTQWTQTQDLPPALRREIQSSLQSDQAIISSVEQFVAQVRSAAIEIAGGQDIQVDGLSMALVDATPTGVTLRRAGQNDVLPYTAFPTRVAIEIGERGSKKSVPRWNLAKAADLLVHAVDNEPLETLATPFLQQAVDDGYVLEAEQITQYFETHLSEPITAEVPLPTLTKDDQSDAMASFRAANGYKNPALTKLDRAPAILDQLLYGDCDDEITRAARLCDAISVAVRMQDFHSMSAAMEELGRLAEIENVRGWIITPVKRAMRADLSRPHARQLASALLRMVSRDDSLPFLNEVQAEFLRNAQTLVTEFKLSELDPALKRLDQP